MIKFIGGAIIGFIIGIIFSAIMIISKDDEDWWKRNIKRLLTTHDINIYILFTIRMKCL